MDDVRGLLRDRMKELGMSVADLARKRGVTYPAVRHFLYSNDATSVAKLVQYAQLLDCRLVITLDKRRR